MLDRSRRQINAAEKGKPVVRRGRKARDLLPARRPPGYQHHADRRPRMGRLRPLVHRPSSSRFQTGRRRVREALDADGVANEIETAVAALLPVPAIA